MSTSNLPEPARRNPLLEEMEQYLCPRILDEEDIFGHMHDIPVLAEIVARNNRIDTTQASPKTLHFLETALLFAKQQMSGAYLMIVEHALEFMHRVQNEDELPKTDSLADRELEVECQLMYLGAAQLASWVMAKAATIYLQGAPDPTHPYGVLADTASHYFHGALSNLQIVPKWMPEDVMPDYLKSATRTIAVTSLQALNLVGDLNFGTAAIKDKLVNACEALAVSGDSHALAELFVNLGQYLSEKSDAAKLVEDTFQSCVMFPAETPESVMRQITALEMNALVASYDTPLQRTALRNFSYLCGQVVRAYDTDETVREIYDALFDFYKKQGDDSDLHIIALTALEARDVIMRGRRPKQPAEPAPFRPTHTCGSEAPPDAQRLSGRPTRSDSPLPN
jgi:hypothetical protein